MQNKPNLIDKITAVAIGAVIVIGVMLIFHNILIHFGQ